MDSISESLKTILIGVTTALSISAIIGVGTMYMDVQLLKSRQQQLEVLSSVVQNLDKQVALNNQALDILNSVVEKLNNKLDKEDGEHERRNNR